VFLLYPSSLGHDVDGLALFLFRANGGVAPLCSALVCGSLGDSYCRLARLFSRCKTQYDGGKVVIKS
jgi:hypothetical protein